MLIQKGAKLDLGKNDGGTPLFVGSQMGHEGCVRCLLTAGAKVNKTTKDGQSPLLIGCAQNHLGCVTLLLEKGAKVNLADHAGLTPLLSACSNGHVEIVQLLITTHNASRSGCIEVCAPLQLARRILERLMHLHVPPPSPHPTIASLL